MGRLAEALNSSSFVVTSELTPPKGTDLDELFAKADLLRDLVTAFNLTESHAARMAMDPVAVGHLLIDRGIEPIVQMTSRDKNRLAIQASILGAAALGVSNLVFMGGIPRRMAIIQTPNRYSTCSPRNCSRPPVPSTTAPISAAMRLKAHHNSPSAQ